LFLVQQVLSTKTTQEWESFFAPLDVMVEPVRQPEHILQTEPQFASGSRPVSVSVEIEGKKFVLPALPIVMTGTISSHDSVQKIRFHRIQYSTTYYQELQVLLQHNVVH
jgi:crotonobetainyl-CoA:carnitine CoA-transferase CaiB-like acyl-CoA transferase